MEINRNFLLQIANGIQAANKIQDLYSSHYRGDGEENVRIDTASMINNLLGIIAEYSPENYRLPISSAMHRTNLYSNAYKSVKNNVQLARGQKMEKDMIAGTINSIRPVLSPNRQATVTKVLKIYDILKS